MRLNLTTLTRPIENNRGQVGTLGTPSNGKALTCPQNAEITGDKRGQTDRALQPGAEMSPVSPVDKTKWGHCKPLQTLAVPNVPSVPTKKHIAEDLREAFEERAGIREFDGGLNRGEAERAAEDDLLITVNIRGLRRAEVRTPKTLADALALLELIEQFTNMATLQ